MKKAEGLKTLLFAILVAVIGQLEVYNWADIFTEANQGWIITGIGFLIGAFRAVTKGKMFGVK